MENKRKIIYFFLIAIPLIIISCNNKNEIKNPELYFLRNNGNGYIKIDKNIIIDSVYTDNIPLPINKVIDFKTFDYLYKFKTDSVKINNNFYTNNPVKFYFKDKKFLYFLVSDTVENFKLLKKCRVNEYELIGGEYLKIYPSIYWQGKLIMNADYSTFKTVSVPQNKSERDLTVGLDKNNIFYGDIIMSSDVFNELFWTNKDSLRQYYNY